MKYKKLVSVLMGFCFMIFVSTSLDAGCSGCDCIEGQVSCWAQTVSGGQPGYRYQCVHDPGSCNYCDVMPTDCYPGNPPQQ